VIHLISACAMVVTGAAAAAVPMPNPTDYVGKQVIELDVPDELTVTQLLDDGLSALACRPAPGPGPWLVDADQLAMIEALGLDHSPLIPDMAAHQRARNAQRRAARAAARGLDAFYSDYRTYDEYQTRIDQFLTDHADIATSVTLGQSHEGRDIRGVVINVDGTDKPAVLFNGCQHAREWISPPTTWYIADMLADGYGVDSRITALLDRVEVVVIPITNPDGYEYTYNAGGYRFWRKNRRDNSGSCEGVDLNRNWGADWNGGESTSTDPCSDVYVGPSSMSEPEVQALANYCLGHGDIRAQIDFHSYSQLILEPRGYTTVPPPDWDALHALGGEMAAGIQSVHGLSYTHDNPCHILYCASGTLIDWPYETYGASSFTIELRPSSGSGDGFDPPPSQILPCAEENFEAALVLIEDVAVPMTIDLPMGPPSIVHTDAETSFAVRVVERSEAPDSSTATLHYRGGAGAFSERGLTHLGGESYEASLPAFECDDSPEYYVSVASVGGTEVRYPLAAPDEVLTSEVVSELDVAFDDDGETNPGWSVSGTASDGHWNRGVPAGGGDRGDPPTDGDGSGQCWLTDNVAGNSDVDGGYSALTSPELVTPGDGWTMSYWRWFSNDYGASPNEDVMLVEWSEDGSTWSLVEQIGPTGASGGWVQTDFDLDALGMSGVESFRLRVTAEDAGSGSVVEAGFDGVQIVKMDCVDANPCPGDLDGDGTVGVDDVLLVLGAFGTNDPAGDLNGDGIVDVNDILGIVAAFGPC
jgi:murein tripeptide amidase MpaA